VPHDVKLQIGRFHNLARRVLNIRGPDSFGHLGGITGELDLLNTPLPDMLHAGWRSYMIGILAAGDATHLGQLSLSVNPTDQMLVEITSFRCKISGGVAGGSAQLLEVAASSAAAAQTGGASNPVGVGRDSRIWLPTGASNCALVATAHTADGGIGVFEGNLFPDNWDNAVPVSFFDVVRHPGEGFVLSPGQGLTFRGSLVNQTIRAWICWRERNVEAGELLPTT
jgi:hypothetical protein